MKSELLDGDWSTIVVKKEPVYAASITLCNPHSLVNALEMPIKCEHILVKKEPDGHPLTQEYAQQNEKQVVTSSNKDTTASSETSDSDDEGEEGDEGDESAESDEGDKEDTSSSAEVEDDTSSSDENNNGCEEDDASSTIDADDDTQHRGSALKQCSVCGLKYTCEVNIRLHYKTHKTETTFKCACGQAFGTKHLLQKHQWKKHISDKQCTLCNFTCTGEDKRLHKHNVHGYTRKKQITCKLCFFQSNTRTEMDLHKKDEHRRRSCKLCSFQCRIQSKMIVHMNDKHQITHKCALCQSLFATNFELVQHKQNIHQIVQMHICTLCQCSFAKKSELTLHKKTHYPNPVSCPMCPLNCLNQRGLQRHLRVTHFKKIKL